MATLIVIGEHLRIRNLLDQNSNGKFNIHFYDNLGSAYNDLKSDYFKILVLDLDNGGFQSYKNILKSNGFKNQLSIIALTSDDSLENIRQLKESSINEIIIKPVDNSRFNKVLLNIIDQRKQA